MSKGGRPKAPLILGDDERLKLEAWASRPHSIQRLAQRANIILACSEGLEKKAVAARLRVNPVTVGKRRRRFLDDNLGGLVGEPRPGAPPGPFHSHPAIFRSASVFWGCIARCRIIAARLRFFALGSKASTRLRIT
ncbi:MAG: helix-turn-helix domain-containing protein, partial [Planctomycetota bacterium]|nr:helix-turn-helix domain-containing protein [Planctomycetota bacterium]